MKLSFILEIFGNDGRSTIGDLFNTPCLEAFVVIVFHI